MVTAVEGNISGVVALATSEPPVVHEVGGKAASLIRLAQAGFDVPRGAVFAAGFFEPWLAQVRSSPEWQAVLAAARSCDAASPSVEQRAEVADCCARGVAFSLNPLTNDFDEVLINASWGLGDALVTGEITPDTVVVDTVTGEIVEQRLGDKGGDRPDEPCLDNGRIADLKDTVKRIEALYGEPVDVEWAFAEGRLRILQARPITTYVPLHESLQTAPGEPRKLYMDG